MKTKNLVIIFILFLLITLGGGLVVFLTGAEKQLALNKATEIVSPGNQPATEKKLDEIIKNKPVFKMAGATEPTEPEPIVQPEKTAPPAMADKLAAEQIQAVMLINGLEYRTTIKPDSSVYDLMNTLKDQKKIDFKGKSYSDLGFFVEEINGVKNNPSGKNWLYYINGQPAQAGISNYLIKVQDIIEWKYENKSF